MAFYYALSDPHGCDDVLGQALGAVDLQGDNQLYLLGDYVTHETSAMEPEEYAARCTESLSLVRDLQAGNAGKVHVLPGNHELMLMERVREGELSLDPGLMRWLGKLPPFAKTEDQIFVHAGIDEEAEDLWHVASDVHYFCGKVPPSYGHFEKDIVAGHLGASGMAAHCGVPDYHGVFWDGASHYYIDGTTEQSGCIPILRYDTQRRTYDQLLATADGVEGPSPIDAFMNW